MKTGLDGGPGPMDGIVLCCTSISPEKRADLALVAVQMGAIHKFDLTSDVTHLIVGDTETPKYKFVAKERPDVKCLLPEWVEAIRELWRADVEPDIQALESRCRLPALYNLRVCVTGFEDLAFRKKLEDDVNNNGGEYRGNLTKDVTHLIAKEPLGAKYKYAIDWNIKVVAVEWLEQSLERGMILDEHLYNLSIPPAERGRNAWIRRLASTSSLSKRSFDGDTAANGPRKLRRTASAKLNSQNVGFWTDIVSGDFKSAEQKHNQWSEELVPQRPVWKEESSTATKSVGTLTERSESHIKPSATHLSPAAPPLDAAYGAMLQKEGIFAGVRLCLHGFNEKKTSILHKHLLSRGAEILPDHSSFTPTAMSTPNNEFLLVPHDLRNDSIPTIPADLHQPVMVTDMWVERCLHQKKNIKPEENVTNTPFRRFPIAGFERLVVCSTRFEDVDLLHVSKAVKLMGATYDEEFSPKASVLVCNKMVPGNEKLRHARHWNTPVVTADWLWSSIRSGKLREFEAYLVQPCSVNPDPSTDEHKEELRGQPRGESKPSKTEQIESATITKSSSPRTHEMKDRSPKSADTGPFSRNDITTIHNDKQDQPPIPTDSKTFPQPIPHDSAPLREISPNSSPPKPTSPLKPTTTTTTEPPSKLPSRDPNLSSTISSLLAHHQNARSLAAATKPNTTTSPNPSPTKLRRKRQLLGRAPSNASNLSRASSVDTINTDGVGTPVELTRSASAFSTSNKISALASRNLQPSSTTTTTTTTTAADGATFDPLATYPSSADNAIPSNDNHEAPQMTQLGYEDPDALAWREKLERKLGRGLSRRDAGEEAGRGGRVKEIGRVKDLTGKGAGGVGRRTRQAQAMGR